MFRSLIFSLACFVSLLASSNESCFGTYKSTNQKLPVKFIIGDNGVLFFKALGHTYNAGGVNIEYLGMFGNSEILQIKYSDTAGQECVMKLFAVIVNNKLQLITGYLINFKLSEDNSLLIHRLTPINLCFTPKVEK